MSAHSAEIIALPQRAGLRRQLVAADAWGSLGPSDVGPAGAAYLEEALAALVAAAGRGRLDEARLAAVLARLGLGGRPPVTLAEAGRLAGLTGERVRQLEARLRKHFALAGAGLAAPELDAALVAVARAAPVPVSQVGRVLAEAGISAGPFSAESLVRAAQLLGRELPFAVSGAGPGAAILPRVAAAAAAHASLIEARARRQVERCGAFTVAWLEKELADERISVSRRQIKVVLESSQTIVDCGQRWFSFRDVRSVGSFVRASRRMLAVTSPLSVASLHDGLRRHNAFRRLPAPPPVAVLAEAYRCHPAFEVGPGGMVSSSEPVDPSVIGPLNQSILEILRQAPAGVMARPELLDACHQARLNLTSVNLYTTYSECLQRIGPALFAPRGAAAKGAAAPTPARSQPRRGDGGHYGWTEDGRPWMVARITPSTWANGVVHVPAVLRRVLEEGRFACTDGRGAHVTTLGIDTHGNSWGWTGFLRRAQVDPGGLVRATFDTKAQTVVLEVVPPGGDGGGAADRR